MSFLDRLELTRLAPLEVRSLFPTDRLSRLDYILAGAVLICCFFLFFHRDLWRIGWATLNYLYGQPLHFYDNSKCIMVAGRHDVPATAYPPTVYVLFAGWLAPFGVAGALTGPETDRKSVV